MYIGTQYEKKPQAANSRGQSESRSAPAALAYVLRTGSGAAKMGGRIHGSTPAGADLPMIFCQAARRACRTKIARHHGQRARTNRSAVDFVSPSVFHLRLSPATLCRPDYAAVHLRPRPPPVEASPLPPSFLRASWQTSRPRSSSASRPKSGPARFRSRVSLRRWSLDSRRSSARPSPRNLGPARKFGPSTNGLRQTRLRQHGWPKHRVWPMTFRGNVSSDYPRLPPSPRSPMHLL